MSKDITLGDGMTLPIDVVTQAIAIVGKRGRGKSLALDTPIATEGGWTTMGAIRVGERVFDENGRLCNVTAVHEVRHDRDCYEVRFNDGSVITADGEHLWATELMVDRMAQFFGRPRPLGVRTTEQIRATLRHGRRGDLNHSIPVAAALELPIATLPIEPYVLGAWLGDGATSGAKVTSADPEIIAAITSAGYEVHALKVMANRCADFGIGAGPDGVPLHKALRLGGLLGTKHIPDIYLRASVEQRRALLQGLMDTDGWVQDDRGALIALSDERLAEDVRTLIVSLGYRVFRRRKPTTHKDSIVMSFTPEWCPFQLPRKATEFRARSGRRHSRRMITSVEPVPTVPVRCISVDSGSHLYLAGRDLIPTHNTATAKVLVEEMVRAGQQVIVMDTVGAWWGLRSSLDGKSAGLQVVVFGGQHADVPLEAGAGAVIARALMAQRVPAVIDLSGFRKTEQRRFSTAFIEELYHSNRDPLHVVFDEADEFAPQQPGPDTRALLAAMEDFVRRGRLRGLGCTLVSQRPAVIHKDVLTQVEVLITMGLTGPRDVSAIDDWVKLHATDEQAREVRSSLASLPVGTAWVWSPEWLETLRKVQVRRITTFDSSATPKVGSQRYQPKVLAQIDIAALGAEITATVQRAQEDDPNALRQHIARLERQLREQPAAAEAREVIVEVPAVAPAVLDELLTRHDQLQERATGLREEIALLDATVGRLGEMLAFARRPAARPTPARTPTPTVRRTPPSPHPKRAPTGDGERLAKAEKAIATALAMHGTLSNRQIGLHSGYSHKSGSFANNLSSMRTRDLITGSGAAISLTDAGFDALEANGGYEPLPTGRALVDFWLARLPRAQGAMLAALLEVYPGSLSLTELGEATGYSPESGSFANNRSKLNVAELIHGSRDALFAADTLGEAHRQG